MRERITTTGALLAAGLIAIALGGCGAVPPPTAINQLGNRVEAGREARPPAVAHHAARTPGIHAPYAIAAGARGVWFTEYSAPMLGLMEPDGQIRQVDLDQNGFPERLTVARDGAVWFTDPQGDRIGRVFPDSGKADYYSVPTPKSGPAGIAAAPDGSIWFTEHAANQVAIFVPPGADRPSPGAHGFREFELPLGGGPAGLAVGADGSVWFAENAGNRIGRIRFKQNADAPIINEYPLPVPDSHPNSIAIGADGDVYFTELAASRLGKVTPQGLVSEIGLPVNGPALDIAAGPDGSIWVTVPRAHAICRLHPGKPIDTFYLPDTAVPAFITNGGDGNLYFTEPGGKIARLTPLGVLTQLGVTE